MALEWTFSLVLWIAVKSTSVVCILRHSAAAAFSGSSASAAVLLTHSLPACTAVRCISVLPNAVICASDDGYVHRIPFTVICCSCVFPTSSKLEHSQAELQYEYRSDLCTTTFVFCVNCLFFSML